jgi:DNA-binding SARP family transcriptional activator/DNA-binding transcriptional ArsR family regulator
MQNSQAGEASGPRLALSQAPDPVAADEHLMQAGVLGPLTLRRGGELVTPSAPKLRQVLSLLVLQANSVTRVDQLVEELWEESPPPSALTTVQTYIYQLRKLLGLADTTSPAGRGRREDNPVLLSHPGGYVLRLPALTDIDACLFEQLAERGRQELMNGQITVAADTLRVGLGLWRGNVLEGVSTGPLLYAQVARLEERRRTVLGLRIEADLQLGRHREITGELTSLVSAEPTREDFSAKLMLALYRCGRRADALQVYQRIRSTMVEELGLDPAAELQQLHQLMLAADSSLDLPSGGGAVVSAGGMGITRQVAVTPAQLPAEIPDFVGRSAELEEFQRLLPDGHGLRVVNLVGRPGVGKSTFAIHAARSVREQFRDGQLYVSRSDGRPTRDVLLGFLKALGADERDVPAGLGEAAMMFRSWTADRKLLMVLDDVGSPEHLHHLLPGGAACAVLVTSRTRIGGLQGGVAVKLPVLTAAESVSLLSAVIRDSRVADEPDAALKLVELADRLPLALRAIAAKLAARPSWRLSRMVDRLSNERNRLEELCYGGFDVLGRLTEAYQLLSARQRWVFRRLAVGASQPLTVNQISELVSMNRQTVETILDELVDADLVEERQTPHDEPQHLIPTLIRLVGLAGSLAPWWTKDRMSNSQV